MQQKMSIVTRLEVEPLIAVVVSGDGVDTHTHIEYHYNSEWFTFHWEGDGN
jgi:hypothetical protein